MQDLGLTDEQKLMVALVFGGIIILPRFFGFDTRPRTKYGEVMRRQKVAEIKRKREEEKKKKNKVRRSEEQSNGFT